MYVWNHTDIKVLKAQHGDSILITSHADNRVINILVDGGPRSTYSQKVGPLLKKGELKFEVDRLRARGEYVDLLVLTHIDDDHIGGLLAAYEDQCGLKDIVRKVWFNSGRSIANGFKLGVTENLDVSFNVLTSNLTGVTQGVSFENYIKNSGVWDEGLLISGHEEDFFGLKLTILSPGVAELKQLLKKWQKEKPSSITASKENDHGKSLEELIAEDKFSEDNKPHNGSSIAFILEVGGKKIMLLGDSFPSVVCKALTGLGYSPENKINLELCKLSHHGSKGNTSDELLQLIKCDNFVVSTDSSRHGLPDKVTIARVFNRHPNATVFFNYQATIEKVFKDGMPEGRSVKFIEKDFIL